jgi:drug/metabolite transporter (DMT)-like permease
MSIRYIIASLVLVSIAGIKGEHRKISMNDWYKFAVLGFLGYTIAQGLQCVGLISTICICNPYSKFHTRYSDFTGLFIERKNA